MFASDGNKNTKYTSLRPKQVRAFRTVWDRDTSSPLLDLLNKHEVIHLSTQNPISHHLALANMGYKVRVITDDGKLAADLVKNTSTLQVGYSQRGEVIYNKDTPLAYVSAFDYMKGEDKGDILFTDRIDVNTLLALSKGARVVVTEETNEEAMKSLPTPKLPETINIMQFPLSVEMNEFINKGMVDETDPVIQRTILAVACMKESGFNLGIKELVELFWNMMVFADVAQRYNRGFGIEEYDYYKEWADQLQLDYDMVKKFLLLQAEVESILESTTGISLRKDTFPSFYTEILARGEMSDQGYSKLRFIEEGGPSDVAKVVETYLKDSTS